MTVLIAIVAFAVAIGILVVVHEYGHYAVARLCGVKVLRFSIGFGKPLLRHVAKDGVEWTIAALPLGGYVKMLDEREFAGLEPAPGDPLGQPRGDSITSIAPEDLPRAFNRQPVYKRIAIVAAGPVANFLLAIVLFAGIYVAGVSEPAPLLATPTAGTLAAQAGIAGGTNVVALRDPDRPGAVSQPIRSFTDLHWKMLDAALDRRRVVLDLDTGPALGAVANAAASPASSPASRSAINQTNSQANNPASVPTHATLDLSELPRAQVDDDLMAQLGLMPYSGATHIVNVEAGSAAAQAGLQAGDQVVSLDGRGVASVSQMISSIQAAAGRAVELQVLRQGRTLSLRVVPQAHRDETTGQSVGRIGAALGGEVKSVTVRYGPLESLARGARRTWDISVFSVRMFGRMIVGQASLKNLSGPVTIADYAGKSARLGLAAFVSFLALVSISLGVLNLMPIPVLDGGHLLYYLVEVATGKAVSERWQGILQRAGLVCILALSVLALFNDLSRLIRL